MKSFSVKNHIPNLFIAMSICLLTSCAEKVDSTFTSLWDEKFNSCGTICHSANADDGTENGPDLSSKSNFYNNLLSKSSKDYPAWARGSTSCENDFITRGKANESTLAGSLIQSVADSMKANFFCDTAYNEHNVKKQTIADKELEDALIKWINDGAQNN